MRQTSVVSKSGYKDSKYPIATALVVKYKETTKPYWLKDDIIATTEKVAQRISNFIFGNA